MNSALLHFANLVSAILPQTRGFGLRRAMYRASGVTLGAGVKINGGVVFQYPNVSIGSSTWIGRRSEFACSPRGAVLIGARCDVSQDVLFVTGSHEIGPSDRRAGSGLNQSITVGDGCWIGARVTILGGTELGVGTVVAAGAVVTGVFPPNVLVGGVPAKVIRSLA